MWNTFELIGNLTKKPVLRKTNSGIPVTNLDIAHNYWVGEEKRTDYLQVTLWKDNAVNACKYLDTGRQVFVNGTIKPVKQEISNKKYTFNELHAESVKYLGSNNQGNSNHQNNSSDQQGQLNSYQEDNYTQVGNNPFQRDNENPNYGSNPFEQRNTNPFGR